MSKYRLALRFLGVFATGFLVCMQLVNLLPINEVYEAAWYKVVLGVSFTFFLYAITYHEVRS